MVDDQKESAFSRGLKLLDACANRRVAVGVFLVTLAALTATSLTVLHRHSLVTDFAGFTDFSALRVLDGELPYRDFWTLYAPGSMYVLAGAFALFGREHIVSQSLAMVATAAAVACFYLLASRVLSRRIALSVAVMFALAFHHSAYHWYFSTYPPAITFLWIGAWMLVSFFDSRSMWRLVGAGIWFGVVTHFKHDVGAYACVAGACALLFTPDAAATSGPNWARRLGWVCVLAVSVVLTILPATILLLAATGKDMVNNLVIYPVTVFRHARPEGFPMWLPPLAHPDWQHAGRAITEWFVQNFPLALVAVCLPAIWRRRHSYAQAHWAVVIFAISGFVLFCYAASVQVNTHMVTLTALACVLAGVAVFGPIGTSRRGQHYRWIVVPLMVVWILAYLAEPAYHFAARFTRPRQFVGVPGLAGIRAYNDEVDWMRGLNTAMAEAAPTDAPVFLASQRNDMVVYCSPLPYWIAGRRIVTRHHQLHPAVTDTAAYQKRMIEDLESSPPAVVVREHRFEDEALDREFESMSIGLRKFNLSDDQKIGAVLLDKWINAHYEPGPKFGMYEVMRRRHRPDND